MSKRWQMVVTALGAALVVTFTLAMVGFGSSPSAAQAPEPASTDVAAGQFLSCGLTDDGATTEVLCWGGIEGRAGTTVPTMVDGLAGASHVDVGMVHACAVLGDGSVACWGSNSRGQLGDGSLTTRGDPVAVTGLADAVQVGAGYEFSCARTTSGTVWCWGDNGSGQLGDGTTRASTTPVQVQGLADAVSIDVGSGHACAVRTAGAVACWGFNGGGQLGDGTTTSRSAPVPVVGIDDATTVASGDRHSCALTTAGTVRCWGDNDRGLLGDGTDLPRSGPVEVIGIDEAVGITTGHTHSCAPLTTGRVLCWGANGLNLLGDDNRTAWSPPVEAIGITDASTVDVGFKHTCATGPTQTWCWGTNFGGQLGTGDRFDRGIPTPVAGSATVTTIGGRVLTTDGVPVQRVEIDLYAEGRVDYLGSIVTGPDGIYAFDVAPGCHVVTFIAPTGTTFVGGGAFANVDVCVSDGETRADIDAVVVDGGDNQATITGLVRFEGPASLPANGVSVDLFTSNLNGDRLTYLGSTSTGPTDGSFTFEDLEPACHVVTFIAPEGTMLRGPDGELVRWLNEQRCPGNGETERVNARLVGEPDEATIEVRIEAADGAGVPGVTVDVFVAGADGTRSSFLTFGDTGADGVARFDVAAGCYVVVAIAPDGRTFDTGGPWFEQGRCLEPDETATDLVARLG